MLDGNDRTFVTSDGVKLHYTVDDFTDPWKTSDVVILLHPALTNLARFYAWMPILTPTFRVVRLDARGHGQSQTPPLQAPVTIERLAQDVVEVMDYLGIESAYISGSSGGGYIAQYLGIAHTNRVRKLALFSSTPGLRYSSADLGTWLSTVREKGVDGLFSETLRDRVDPEQVGPGYVQWIMDEAKGMDREWTSKFLTAMANIDLAPRLKEIEASTLVVEPGGDTLGIKAGYELLRQIPNLEYKVYEGLPHAITSSAPERCANELKAFLLEP